METQYENPPPRKSTRVGNPTPNIEHIHFVLASLGDNCLMIDKSLLNSLNDLVAANYLSFLLERFKFHLKEGSLEDGWFYLKQEKVTQELKISKYIIRRVKTKLKDLGIIKTKMKGLPQKEYFLIDILAIKQRLIKEIKYWDT